MITYYDMKRFLDEKGINYQTGDGNAIILRETSSKTHTTYLIGMDFQQEGYVDILLSICVLDRSNLNERLKELINDFNTKYRFFKFYYRESSYNQYDITLAATAIVKENDSVDEITELVWRGIDMADIVYPDIQRAIWR